MPATSFSGDCFLPALGQRARRLALEIEHDEIAVSDAVGVPSGAQRLTQMIIAMNADALAGRLRFRESRVRAKSSRRLREQLDRMVGGESSSVAKLRFERFQHSK